MISKRMSDYCLPAIQRQVIVGPCNEAILAVEGGGAEELLELTWMLAEFIALAKVIYVLGIQYGGHVHV